MPMQVDEHWFLRAGCQNHFCTDAMCHFSARQRRSVTYTSTFCLRSLARQSHALIVLLSTMVLLPVATFGGTNSTASDEILLGMSTALSGPAANLGQNMRDGVQAGLARANREGGIHGRPLRLIVLDDGYEPARTAPNMRQLLEKDGVLAVIGDVGTPTGVAALPIVNERKTLFFAPFTGAGAFRKTPPDRYVINYRASYAEEVSAIVDALIKVAGLSVGDIAMFTQKDAYGDAGYAGCIAALKRYGLKDERSVLHVRYERNTMAVENALATLLFSEHEPRAVLMVGAYGPCAKFIRLADQAGLKALFYNVSFVGSSSLAAELKNTNARVVVTQVVPHPTADQLPIVRDFQADLRLFCPQADAGFGTLEGYVAARILVTALRTIPGEPTREEVINALESLDEFDLGLGEPLTLGPKDHQACHRVWLTVLRGGRFAPILFDEIKSVMEAAQ